MLSLDQAPAICFVLTRDHAAARAFYERALGLACVGEDAYAVTFALGSGTTLRLTTVPGYRPGPHPALGWRVVDIDANVDTLARAGVACEVYEGLGQDARGVWTSPDGATRIVWFKDPEGNVLSLTQMP